MPAPEIKDGGIWICHTCKTVIGPIIDDDKNKCGCDVYEFEYSRYIPDRADLAKPSEWIRVDDRLPEEMLRVLLVTNPRGEVGIGRRDEDNWCDDYHGYVSVTHWQPLPSPPDKECTG